MNWYDFMIRNLGKILGGIAGLIVSVILLVFGFWKGVFIIFCIFAGVFLGWHLDNGEQMRKFLQTIFHRKEE